MNGPLHRFFADDHRRLVGPLEDSMAQSGRIDLGPFGAFRAGLLKRIGMEEKILFLRTSRRTSSRRGGNGSRRAAAPS